jgi:HSP20 family protein
MHIRRMSQRYGELRGWTGLLPGSSLAARRVSLVPGGWQPPADVYETASAVVVLLELAGVEEDALEVLLFPDAVVVRGQRDFACRRHDVVYHTAQIGFGPFVAEVALPGPVEAGRATLRYERGLLEVVLPKAVHGGGSGDV